MTETALSSGAQAVTNHLTTYLGKVQDAWTDRNAGVKPDFALVRYERLADDHIMIFGTWGLSQYPLLQESGAGLRQELLMTWPQAQPKEPLFAHLQALAEAMLENGEALQIGELLLLAPEPNLPTGSEKSGEKTDDEPFVAWYVTLPYFLPEGGAVCRDVSPPLALAWVIPVYASEQAFIMQMGDEAFDSLLIENRTAFFEWPRKSLA